jgi:uncharacterized alpha-E superfamily protein
VDDGIPRYRALSANLNAALYDKDRPESVVAILKRVQEAARNVRDRLSLDSWRAINRLEALPTIRPATRWSCWMTRCSP